MSADLVSRVGRRGLFYGWIIVAVGFVMQAITSISTTGMSTYVVPLQQELGWSNAAIGLGRSFTQLESIFGPFTGVLVDRIGPRRMVLIGVLIHASSLVLFSRVGGLVEFYGVSVSVHREPDGTVVGVPRRSAS